MKTKIPLYRQNAEAQGGVFIFKFGAVQTDQQAHNLGTHRDDFFIFFVLTQGKAAMKCDMTDVEIIAPSIFLLKPFQVHAPGSISENATGYYISAAPFLIPNHCFEVFQHLTINEQVHQIGEAQQKELIATASLLQLSFKNTKPHQTQIINGLFNALVYQFSNSFQSAIKLKAKTKKQSWLIANRFKKLISLHGFLESPSFFAMKLNISTSHLNHCVNTETGKSITYWLQNAMVIEAQRLLYYTQNDVKEIAFDLGFQDHTYFSRLFKKITGETPLAFRRKFRE